MPDTLTDTTKPSQGCWAGLDRCVGGGVKPGVAERGAPLHSPIQWEGHFRKGHP